MENREKNQDYCFHYCLFFSNFSYFTYYYQKRRKQKKSSQNNLCYVVKDNSKPQNSFKHILADNSYTQFKHLKRNEDKSTSNSHPYEEEIMGLLQNLTPQVGNFSNGEMDMEMMSSPYIWVETKSQLYELVKVLSNERVFAVDTEHHSLRSFLGFVALMQISTKNEDYLLDTIALHDEVFHGADNDVLWLQRDFHIYVVNLFDTAKACEVLSKPQKSLAYLLETYCGVFSNKTLQREDWRLHPLSEEMVEYARADAHYLLHIADCLITELKAQDTACLDDKSLSFLEANRRSNMVCLQLYTKEIEAFPGDSAASTILSQYLDDQGGVTSHSETKDLVGRLCMWRDFMARLHDESLRFVLSDQALAALASKVSKTIIEVYGTISEADINLESTVGSSLVSPSPDVCSHIDDLTYLLQGKMEISHYKHLGPDGTCPLSVYNYALLTKFNLEPTNGFSTRQNAGKGSKRIGREASRKLFVQKLSCKTPVYRNCRIYANDGRLLCYCDRRKIDWYLHRDLAKLVEENPPAIVLLFEPKGRPEDEGNDFYIQRKHYLRYRIIPSCYRVHFPEHLKSHRSHDIVLVCVDCHEIAHSAAEKHKKKIAAEYGIPLFINNVNHEQAGVSPLQLRTAAMALLRYESTMPSSRRDELTEVVMKYFGGRDVSKADLEKTLLVGMSPYETKKLQKKKGISLQRISEAIIPNESKESMADNTNNGEQTLEELGSSQEKDHPTQMDIGAKGSNLGNREGASVANSAGTYFDKSCLTEKENLHPSDTDEDLESKKPSDDNSNPNYSYGTDAPPNHNHKLSLLGHGPHGKQVVDHLLKEFGEDGIREFCQRWRQVFVEAVHPCFLPGGWDVKHSGIREFGAYSVYNPEKNVTDAAKA
ncbi:hypothetical protein MKX01_022251 [Papaver californicum]|nr:hypothetical protein MKX01_022251 [Papaver californicum]